jgi:hypothetical protein
MRRELDGTPGGYLPAGKRPMLASMDASDRDVLEFIGDPGKTAEQVADRFPAFDLELLVRAELVRPRRTNPVKTYSRRTEPPSDPTFYVLTSRGAEAIGLDPHTLHSD